MENKFKLDIETLAMDFKRIEVNKCMLELDFEPYMDLKIAIENQIEHKCAVSASVNVEDGAKKNEHFGLKMYGISFTFYLADK